MAALSFDAIHQGANEQHAVVWEMEHRIKNHLQLLSSYVRLTAARPGMTMQMLSAELSEKLSAIASVHEALQNAGDDELEVLAAPFLLSVCRPFIDGSEAVKIDCPLDLALTAEQLAPVGMIVSEAVTNAVKHAFGGKTQAGLVTVSLRAWMGEQELIIRDNGVGLIARSQGGSGMPLIAGFARKLNGMLRVRDGDDGGAEVIVTFPQLERP